MKIETFLPTHKVIRQWSDRKKSIEAPLFPNYLFVKTASNTMWPIVAIQGVVRFVAFEGKPAVIKQVDIDIIQRLLKSGYTLYTENDCIIGEKVRVSKGAFAGLEGILVSKKGGSKFCIELESVSRIIAVELPIDMVEKVDCPYSVYD